MTAIRHSSRRPIPVEADQGRDLGGAMVLVGLRVVLLGCAFALVGVLGHVAWKIVNA